MHEIESNNKKIRYEGLKAKLIHLPPDTFEILDTCAKFKKMSLKKYIETLCHKQAVHEAREFIKANEKMKKI